MSSAIDSKPGKWSYQQWFRVTFVAIGAVEVFFATLTMLQGPKNVMSQFGIPEVVVNSPHYLDAMFWVVLHMCFIGTISITLGALVQDIRLQLWLARIFVVFHFVYAYLDVHASDSVLGTGLYQGAASLVTPAISCTMFAAMLHLALRSLGSYGEQRQRLEPRSS